MHTRRVPCLTLHCSPFSRGSNQRHPPRATPEQPPGTKGWSSSPWWIKQYVLLPSSFTIHLRSTAVTNFLGLRSKIFFVCALITLQVPPLFSSSSMLPSIIIRLYSWALLGLDIAVSVWLNEVFNVVERTKTGYVLSQSMRHGCRRYASLHEIPSPSLASFGLISSHCKKPRSEQGRCERNE